MPVIPGACTMTRIAEHVRLDSDLVGGKSAKTEFLYFYCCSSFDNPTSLHISASGHSWIDCYLSASPIACVRLIILGEGTRRRRIGEM